MSYRLKKGRAPGKDLKRIAREQIDTMLRSIDDDSIPLKEKVHAARLHCKQLRALLRLLQPFPRRHFRTDDRRFRRAARQLSHLRDAHVLEQTLENVTGQQRPHPVVPGQSDVQVAAALRQARRDMRRARDSVAAWGLGDIRMYDICAGHGHTYERAANAWHSCVTDPSDEGFHRLRRWSKYLYYQTSLLQPIDPEQLRRQRARLAELAELLGDAHDLAVLEQVLAANGEANRTLTRQVAAEKEARYEKAISLCESVFRRRPARYVADLANCWADWF